MNKIQKRRRDRSAPFGLQIKLFAPTGLLVSGLHYDTSDSHPQASMHADEASEGNRQFTQT